MTSNQWDFSVDITLLLGLYGNIKIERVKKKEGEQLTFYIILSSVLHKLPKF